MQFWKMHKKIDKNFFVFKRNAPEYVALNCLFYE